MSSVHCHVFGSNNEANTKTYHTSIYLETQENPRVDDIVKTLKSHDDFPWTSCDSASLRLTTVAYGRNRLTHSVLESILDGLKASHWSDDQEVYVVPSQYWNCTLSYVFRRGEIEQLQKDAHPHELNCFMAFTTPNVHNFNMTWKKYEQNRNLGMLSCHFVVSRNGLNPVINQYRLHRKWKYNTSDEEANFTSAERAAIEKLWKAWLYVFKNCNTKVGQAGARPSAGVPRCPHCSHPNNSSDEQMKRAWKQRLLEAAARKEDRPAYASLHVDVFLTFCVFFSSTAHAATTTLANTGQTFAERDWTSSNASFQVAGTAFCARATSGFCGLNWPTFMQLLNEVDEMPHDQRNALKAPAGSHTLELKNRIRREPIIRSSTSSIS